MTISSWPFENQPTTELQYSRLFRELQDNGVAAPFGAGDLAVSASGTNVISVAAGNAIVRGFMFQSTAVESRNVPVITAGAHRQDLVVLRLDPNNNRITIEVVQGTADAVPAPTQTWPDDPAGVWEMPLAAIDTTSAGVVTVSLDRRMFLGDRWQTWSTLTRPANPRLGKTGYNVTINKIEWWDGISWNATPTKGDSGWVTMPITSFYNGSGNGFLRLRRIDTAVYFDLYATGTGSGGTGAITLDGSATSALTGTVANGIKNWLPPQPNWPDKTAVAANDVLAGSALATPDGQPNYAAQLQAARASTSTTDCYFLLRAQRGSTTGNITAAGPFRMRGLAWLLD